MLTVNFFCLCFKSKATLADIFMFLSYQPNGETKNNHKNDILCLADTFWAKSGSGCLVIPWISAAGAIIPRPTSIPVLAEAWMWEGPTDGQLAPAANTLTLSDRWAAAPHIPHVSTYCSSGHVPLSPVGGVVRPESAVPQLQHRYRLTTAEATFSQ